MILNESNRILQVISNRQEDDILQEWKKYDQKQEYVELDLNLVNEWMMSGNTWFIGGQLLIEHE